MTSEYVKARRYYLSQREVEATQEAFQNQLEVVKKLTVLEDMLGDVLSLISNTCSNSKKASAHLLQAGSYGVLQSACKCSDKVEWTPESLAEHIASMRLPQIKKLDDLSIHIVDMREILDGVLSDALDDLNQIENMNKLAQKLKNDYTPKDSSDEEDVIRLTKEEVIDLDEKKKDDATDSETEESEEQDEESEEEVETTECDRCEKEYPTDELQDVDDDKVLCEGCADMYSEYKTANADEDMKQKLVQSFKELIEHQTNMFNSYIKYKNALRDLKE